MVEPPQGSTTPPTPEQAHEDASSSLRPDSENAAVISSTTYNEKIREAWSLVEPFVGLLMNDGIEVKKGKDVQSNIPSVLYVY